METEFKKFLRKNYHAPSTIHIYTSIIRKIRRENRALNKFNYREVIGMLGKERKEVHGAHHKQTTIAALKRYYTFLNYQGIRDDHPCLTLSLKHKSPKEIISSDLFSMNELSLLFNREERYPILKFRNKVLFSLMVFQGLTPLEIVKLKVGNIVLDKGFIQIPGSRKLCKRKLAIDSLQMKWIACYLEIERPKLLCAPTEFLLLGKTGNPVSCDSLNYLVSTAKSLFPSKDLTAVSIRQSVIAYWMNELEIPLEQVQLMAGHKWISSTQRYLFHSVENDLKVLRRVHPMG
ncbi:MAG: hypothetical protein A2W11_02785 [Ignavibacteria bacterium RBG_16_35_7]|nr:MAG: hypothetical protein A2W11_02785 [Ignavibacteria bacterium RBG_16_35_7]